MSMLQREINRIRQALLNTKSGAVYDKLYAAQQALAWASDPAGFKAPGDLIMGTQEDSADCSAHPRPLQF